MRLWEKRRRDASRKFKGGVTFYHQVSAVRCPDAHSPFSAPFYWSEAAGRPKSLAVDWIGSHDFRPKSPACDWSTATTLSKIPRFSLAGRGDTPPLYRCRGIALQQISSALRRS